MFLQLFVNFLYFSSIKLEELKIINLITKNKTYFRYIYFIYLFTQFYEFILFFCMKINF